MEVADHSDYATGSRGVTCGTPSCRNVATGPLCGSCYARWARGLPPDSRQSVCAIPDCPHSHHSRGLCLTHYKRLLKGSDLSERIHTEKRRGASYRPREAREPMRPVLRPEESETLWSLVGNPSEGVGRTGGVRVAASWEWENRQAEQLGTPEMWQRLADEALERAWADLLDPSRDGYRARLAALRPAKPRVVQSPLLVPIRTGSKSGVMRIRSCA